MRKISIIKIFWKTIKPFLLDKAASTNKMTFMDKEEIIAGDYNTPKVLNIFFPNIVANNLNIVEYSNCEPLADTISVPVLKYVVKYMNHPNIFAIRDVKYRNHPRIFSIGDVKYRNHPRIFSIGDVKYRSHPSIFAIGDVKYRNHPSIFSIGDVKYRNHPSIFAIGDIKYRNHPSIFAIEDVKYRNHPSLFATYWRYKI